MCITMSRNKTFFFVNEEWRRLIEGSSPSIVNTIAANNFPWLGSHWPIPFRLTARFRSFLSPPTQLSWPLYAQDGLTPGQPFPNNTIPANLIDPNAVLELNAGTFPKPNFGTSQYISSIPQPTDVREDVVRIDHAINSKFQLMGHYLHDAVTQTYYPPLWGDSTYPTVGTAMLNPSWSASIQTHANVFTPTCSTRPPSFTAAIRSTLLLSAFRRNHPGGQLRASSRSPTM